MYPMGYAYANYLIATFMLVSLYCFSNCHNRLFVNFKKNTHTIYTKNIFTNHKYANNTFAKKRV
jgi:hypothetical protein